MLSEHREQFIRTVLKHYGIKINDKMSKREVQETFKANVIGIVKDEEKNLDKIYKEGNLIAYWNNQPELEFKRGKLLCNIHFKIYKVG
jgi:hypothetical protein